MKTILAAIFAVMIGLTFAGSTFAQAKTDAPPATEMKKDESKKTETKTETKEETKDNGKKTKKTKKTTKTTEEKEKEKKN